MKVILRMAGKAERTLAKAWKTRWDQVYRMRGAGVSGAHPLGTPFFIGCQSSIGRSFHREPRARASPAVQAILHLGFVNARRRHELLTDLRSSGGPAEPCGRSESVRVAGARCLWIASSRIAVPETSCDGKSQGKAPHVVNKQCICGVTGSTSECRGRHKIIKDPNITSGEELHRISHESVSRRRSTKSYHIQSRGYLGHRTSNGMLRISLKIRFTTI